MIIVDASVLAPALAIDTADGDAARAALSGKALTAPELIDLEVVSAYAGKRPLTSLRSPVRALL